MDGQVQLTLVRVLRVALYCEPVGSAVEQLHVVALALALEDLERVLPRLGIECVVVLGAG